VTEERAGRDAASARGGAAVAHPSLREAVRVWARIALLSFGGPAGQIAVMHRILVEEKRWIGENRFLHALNFCMLLPGPEAQQLCIYIGWLLHRTLGGVIAGVLFVLPGLVSIMALSWVYAIWGNVGVVEALFFGLKAAVLAIVLQAVIRIGGRALRNGPMIAIAAASFVAIFAFDVPFPLIVLAAGLVGYLGARSGWRAFAAAAVTARWAGSTSPTPRARSARRSPPMRARRGARPSASPRSASCSGSRPSSCCSPCSASAMSSPTSRCSSRRWRW
jgi:chromate transport protein ChrA